MSKVILIIEIELEGHHGEYVRWIVMGLIEQHYRVVLALPKNIENHPSLSYIEPLLGEGLSLFFFDTNDDITNSPLFIKHFNLIGRDIRNYKVFKSVDEQVKVKYSVDFVIVPYLDSFLFALALFGSPFQSTRWSGIIMRPDFHHKEMGLKVPKKRMAWLKELLFIRVLKVKSLVKLFTLDETMALYYAKSNKSYAKKLGFLPEPVNQFDEDKSKIQEVLRSLALEEKKYLLVYGALCSRKGVQQLLTALSEMELPTIQVVLAGQVYEDVENVLMKPHIKKLQENGCLKVINRYISKDEEAALFLSAHVLWLGYVGHYRVSGVLVQAARNNIPVIACQEGVIGWQVKKQLLGETVDVMDNQSISKALDMMFYNEKKYHQYKENCANAFTLNTFDHASSELFEII